MVTPDVLKMFDHEPSEQVVRDTNILKLLVAYVAAKRPAFEEQPDVIAGFKYYNRYVISMIT